MDSRTPVSQGPRGRARFKERQTTHTHTQISLGAPPPPARGPGGRPGGSPWGDQRGRPGIPWGSSGGSPVGHPRRSAQGSPSRPPAYPEVLGFLVGFSRAKSRIPDSTKNKILHDLGSRRQNQWSDLMAADPRSFIVRFLWGRESSNIVLGSAAEICGILKVTIILGAQQKLTKILFFSKLEIVKKAPFLLPSSNFKADPTKG